MKLMNKASGELFDRQEERIVLIPFQITIFGGIAMNKRVIRLSFLFFFLVLRQLAYAEDTSNLLSFANSLFDEKSVHFFYYFIGLNSRSQISRHRHHQPYRQPPDLPQAAGRH